VSLALFAPATLHDPPFGVRKPLPEIMRNALSFVVLLGVLTLAGETRAQTSTDADSADALFKSAKAAMDRGDLVTACNQLAESLRLDPAPGTLLNLGECEARSGKVAAALGHFQEGRKALPAGDYRIAFADDKITVLQRRVARLAVRLRGEAPAGLRVERDGVLVGEGLLGVTSPVEPGHHVVITTAPGRARTRADVTLAEGQVETLEIEAGPVALSGEASAPPATNGSNQRTAAWALMGGGAGAVAVGAVLGLVAKGAYDSASSLANCPRGPSSCNAAGVQGGQTAHTEAGVSTGLFVAGGVLAATGAVLYFSAPKEGGASVAPVLGANGAGLSFQGAF